MTPMDPEHNVQYNIYFLKDALSTFQYCYIDMGNNNNNNSNNNNNNNNKPHSFGSLTSIDHNPNEPIV